MAISRFFRRKMGAPQIGAPLMNERDAAAVMGMRPATLRRWRWSGRGPAFKKIGAAVRYAPEDIAAFIEAADRRSTSDAKHIA
jgi:hypothetical protein